MVIAGLPGHAVTFINRAEAWRCFSSLLEEPGGVLGEVVVRWRRTDVRHSEHCRAVAHESTVQVAAEVMTIALMSKRRHSRESAICSKRCEIVTPCDPASRGSAFSSRVSPIGDTIPAIAR